VLITFTPSAVPLARTQPRTLEPRAYRHCVHIGWPEGVANDLAKPVGASWCHLGSVDHTHGPTDEQTHNMQKAGSGSASAVISANANTYVLMSTHPRHRSTLPAACASPHSSPRHRVIGVSMHWCEPAWATGSPYAKLRDAKRPGIVSQPQ
jgi:hypothetical protein